ncbi:MAG: chorismate-binding protein [Okeania sp. SIO2F4]|uniref:chromophore lyase CpcT/CpeT n=1 Tax=Okeania sp. SIO2F4 TaxID=2607790 RepID=UPI001429C91D|nr:chromophore lyase CpcT/CpeT [Okeania sp. SIO2F4]NES03396.1 chorismate-binding protein [Okeania sp. SIO2F4]
MTHSTDITTLARWLSADFSNQQQAFDNPPLFAHIRVCMRPLPYQLLNGLSLYLEQAYDITLNKPYRVRILKLVPSEDHIDIENYAIDQEEEFYGGSRNPQCLETLKTEQIKKLPGCTFITKWTGNSFRGEVEPGKGCTVVRKGKTTYLKSHFEIDEQKFISHDTGCDPETDRQVWGAIAGPFEFVRWTSFADEVTI